MKALVVLRHLLAIATLPFVVVVVVPVWLAQRNGTELALGSEIGQILVQIAGVLLVVVGLVLFVASLRRFATEGEGSPTTIGIGAGAVLPRSLRLLRRHLPRHLRSARFDGLEHVAPREPLPAAAHPVVHP